MIGITVTDITTITDIIIHAIVDTTTITGAIPTDITKEIIISIETTMATAAIITENAGTMMTIDAFDHV